MEGGVEGEKKKNRKISVCWPSKNRLSEAFPLQEKKENLISQRKIFVTHQCKMKDTLSNSKTCPYSSRDKLSQLW